LEVGFEVLLFAAPNIVDPKRPADTELFVVNEASTFLEVLDPEIWSNYIGKITNFHLQNYTFSRLI
jgi:hypothetical protein